MNYTTTIRGADQLIAKFGDSGLVLRPLQRLMLDMAVLGQQVARQEGPRDTGALQRGILRDVQPLMMRVYDPLPYAAVMEFGRRPGAKPPPAEALIPWIKRHGFGHGVTQSLSGARSSLGGARNTMGGKYSYAHADPIKGIAFVLARAIGKRGIKGRFYMRAAQLAIEAALPGRMIKMQMEIEAELATKAVAL